MLETEETVGEGLLTTAEAEALLKLKPNTLAMWRVIGKGPSYLKIGKAVRYSPQFLPLIEQSVTSIKSQKLFYKKFVLIFAYR